MPPTDTFPLVDRLVPGGLAEWLAQARRSGGSFETIAFQLRSEHDISVSSDTIRSWVARTSGSASRGEQ